MIHQTAQRLGLLERLEEKTHQLSRGLRQRLAVGQAIIHRPRVILLDEPASGLDPQARIELSRLLTQLRHQGMTLVVSSHILSELESYSTHMLMIDQGRIRQLKALEEHEDQQRLMEVRLSRDDGRLESLLGGAPGASAINVDGPHARFTFEGDDAALAQLLESLVGAGLSICHFAPRRRNMEESYLESLHDNRQP